MAAIEINGISKRFGSVQAVSDLSFEVDAGRSRASSGRTAQPDRRPPSAIQGLKPDDVGLPDVDFLSFGAALAVMAAWIAALFAAGAALLRARDVE